MNNKRLSLVVGAFLLVSTFARAVDGPRWVRLYNGPINGDEVVCAVLTDAERNVIAVGSSPGSGTAYDIVVLKYSPNGDSLWFKRIAGSGLSNDYAKAAAVDASGAIYLTATTGTYPNYNILTLKLNPDGSEAWRDVYQGSAGKADEPMALVLDGSGNVYVTGSEQDNNSVNDIVTIKYNADGSRGWVAYYDGGAADAPAGIAVASDGAVYVTGTSLQSNDDIITIKYNSSGGQEWAVLFDGGRNAPDNGKAIAVDGAGNCYVTGKTATAPPPGGQWNLITLKYSPTGGEVWQKVYTGSNRGVDPSDLAIGANGLYLTGTVTGTANTDILTMAYNLNTGDTLWVRRFNGAANKNDEGARLLVDALGRIHVVGSSQDANSRSDCCRLRYSASGVLEGSGLYNGTFNNDDKGVAIAVDANNEVVITGVSFGGTSIMSYDIVTVKYDSAAPGVSEGVSFPKRVAGLNISPNPARGQVKLGLALVQPGIIRVWNASGGLCQEFGVPAGSREWRLPLNRLTPGVYIVELRSGARCEKGKLVIE